MQTRIEPRPRRLDAVPRLRMALRQGPRWKAMACLPRARLLELRVKVVAEAGVPARLDRVVRRARAATEGESRTQGRACAPRTAAAWTAPACFRRRASMRPEALREVVEQAVREAVERVSVLEALG